MSSGIKVKSQADVFSDQGLTSPSLETAQKLCKALGVSMDYVFGE